MNPNFPPGAANLAWTYLFLERYSDAGKTVQQAAERGLNFPDLLILPYVIAFYGGDGPGMERAAARAKDNPDSADWMTNTESAVLAFSASPYSIKLKAYRARFFITQDKRDLPLLELIVSYLGTGNLYKSGVSCFNYEVSSYKKNYESFASHDKTLRDIP